MNYRPTTGLSTDQFIRYFTALISQSGTNAPTAIILNNDFDTVSLSRVSAGVYRITFNFDTIPWLTENRTWLMINNKVEEETSMTFEWISTTIVQLTVTAGDNFLDKISIEVRVYNN